jgi:hypothetical protein
MPNLLLWLPAAKVGILTPPKYPNTGLRRMSKKELEMDDPLLREQMNSSAEFVDKLDGAATEPDICWRRLTTLLR